MTQSASFMGTFPEDTTSAGQFLEIARICEQAERYEDMCQAMSALVKMKCASDSAESALDTEERNLLSVAFKNVVGSKRASWRTLAATEDDDSDLLTQYRGFIEAELEAQCLEVLALLEQNLLPRVLPAVIVHTGDGNLDLGPKPKADGTTDAVTEKNKYQVSLVESADPSTQEKGVFYLKMCGDYYRYLAEFRPNSEDREVNYAENSVKHYNIAMQIAEMALEPTHPTRLGLALNLSVCYYEIKQATAMACELAKTAFDLAIAKLDGINDDTYKDSTLIMQLLRDNLTLWTSNTEDDDQ